MMIKIINSFPISMGTVSGMSMCCEWLMNGMMICKVRIVFNAVDIVVEIWVMSWMVLMCMRIVEVRSMVRFSSDVVMSAS